MKKYFDIKNKLFLAPLAGISDRAFRLICKQFGADVTVTEMVSAKGLYYKDKKTASLLSFGEDEKPIGIQLFGSEPDIIEYAVKTVTELSPQFIDINMGMPCSQNSGKQRGRFFDDATGQSFRNHKKSVSGDTASRLGKNQSGI